MNKPILEAIGQYLSPAAAKAFAGGIMTDCKLDRQARVLRITAEFPALPSSADLALVKAEVIAALKLNNFELLIKSKDKNVF